jgi:hypothetical protein
MMWTNCQTARGRELPIPNARRHREAIGYSGVSSHYSRRTVVLRKTLVFAIAAILVSLALTSSAQAWGGCHFGFTHYSPYTGLHHYGFTGYRGGYGGYDRYGYHYGDYRWGGAHYYGGYHYGDYGAYGGARYGYYRAW